MTEDQFVQIQRHVDARANALEEVIGELKTGVRQINHILTGNGEPEKGYVYRTAKNEHDIKNIRQAVQESKSGGRWWLRNITSAAIGAAFAGGVAWITGNKH